MADLDVLRQRLRNQRLPKTEFRTAADVVSWLGAVQSQDYPGARWGVGQRAKGLTDADVEREFDAGAILRTHLMRPTWHFVSPADIRWIQDLTAPRVRAVSAYYDRQLGLDAKVRARSRATLERALRDRTYLTRTEIAAILARAGLPTGGQAVGHQLMHAELDQVICSGPRRGKQLTYALLAERAPQAKTLPREEALAELTRRYFTSHGPATVRDFAWWSGLTVREAKRGLELVKPALVAHTVGDLTYWLVPSRAAAPPVAPSAYLLPNYDEYGIAYKDRGLAASRAGETADPDDIYAHLLVIDGRFAGTWRRTLNRDSVLVSATLRARLSPVAKASLAAAAERYGRFLNLPAILSHA